MAAHDHRLPGRYGYNDIEFKIPVGPSRRDHSPHGYVDHEHGELNKRGVFGRCLELVCRPLPSGRRQRRNLCVLLLLVAGMLGICLFVSQDSRRFVGVDGASGSLSRLLSYSGSSEACSAESCPEGSSPASSTSLDTTEPVITPFVSAAESIGPSVTTLLPHIPPKIWQIYLSWSRGAVSPNYLASWVSRSPSFMYTILDADGARDLVSRLPRLAANVALRVPLWQLTPEEEGAERKSQDRRFKKKNKGKGVVSESDLITKDAAGVETIPLAAVAGDALELYDAMPRRVLRADFLRYLVLALEGGIYSDSDTTLVRPVREWVPESMRSATKLIVGLEADSSPPVGGTTYEVQFCQWTLASAPNHPAMWTMVHRILSQVRARPESRGVYTDEDVLAITGPAAWTEVIYAHINRVAGDGVGNARITWKDLTGMTEPRLFGDTLVLPINGFATGVPHSKADRQKNDATLILHQFLGKWRGGNG